MSEIQLVHVKHGTFEATIPWIWALPPVRILAISGAYTPADQFTGIVEALREVIAPEKLPELDTLDIIELGDVINQWVEKSTQARTPEKREDDE